MQSIPTVTKQLLIINCLVYLATLLIPSLETWCGLHYWQASQFHLYQFFTYMFMHGGFTHLFFNMFALWMFGCVMERTWGAQRFLLYYIICGVGAGLVQEIVQTFSIYMDFSSQGMTTHQFLNMGSEFAYLTQQLNALTTVGASGSIYGILLAFGMTYPEEKMFIIPIPFPIKAKWFVVGYAAVELGLALSNTSDGVAHVAHLGGMLFGFFLIRHWRKSAKKQSSFNGWSTYEGTESRQQSVTILGKIRKWMHLDRKDDGYNRSENFRSTSTHQADWDYNTRKKQEEAEIDAILDKIRRSGYASLSADEKAKLFEASKK